MEVTLTIPEHRRLHAWWNTCTPEETADAMDMAAALLALTRVKSKTTDPAPQACLTQFPTTATIQDGVAFCNVLSLIQDTTACEVSDWDATKAMHTISTRDGVRVLLAIKETLKLRSADMEEFRKVVYTEKSVNAALLISLQSRLPQIPTPCDVSIMHTPRGAVPVVMIGSNSRTSIQLALCAVIGMRGRLNAGEEPAQPGTLKKILPLMCRHIQTRESKIESRIEMLQSMLRDALAEQKEQQDAVYNVQKLRDALTWLSELDDANDVDLDAAIEIVTLHGTDGETPKTSKMTNAQRKIIKNAGGIKHVMQVIMERTRSES